MIIEIRAKNCFVFEDDIVFSMKADMRNKKFGSNVHKENNFNILKTAGVYGPNNVGKTCLIKCIRAIKGVLLNKGNEVMPNIFTSNKICSLGITFLADGRKFSYDFKYDCEKEEYIYESFSEILKDQYNNEKEVCWLKKDTVGEIYECDDKNLKFMIPVVSKNSLLCYVIDTTKFERINEMKQILVGFAEKIDVINMNNIPIQHTIELMKNKNRLQEKIVDFIKNADLYMDNFEYVDELDSSIHFKLIRAIVAMFNNELNTNAQMIFTVHDINLMDCKRMFRKEQIWFVHKDADGVYVYSLAEFTAQQGVRDTTDIMEKYRKGALGALPDPELINSLLSIKGNAREGDAHDK